MTARTQRMLRFEVPVDDEIHQLPADIYSVLAVAAPRVDVVEFWSSDRSGRPWEPKAWFRVVGTGQTVPESWRYLGTAPRVQGLVWHLFATDSEPVEGSPTDPPGPSVSRPRKDQAHD